jgi:hypothetical protein
MDALRLLSLRVTQMAGKTREWGRSQRYSGGRSDKWTAVGSIIKMQFKSLVIICCFFYKFVGI